MPQIPAQKMKKFEVIKQFLASPFATGAYERGEPYSKPQELIKIGETLDCDPDAWSGREWEGQSIVRFFRDANLTYTVTRQLFDDSTKLIDDSPNRERK